VPSTRAVLRRLDCFSRSMSYCIVHSISGVVCLVNARVFRCASRKKRKYTPQRPPYVMPKRCKSAELVDEEASEGEDDVFVDEEDSADDEATMEAEVSPAL
jgi:hypothetical protein